MLHAQDTIIPLQFHEAGVALFEVNTIWDPLVPLATNLPFDIKAKLLLNFTSTHGSMVRVYHEFRVTFDVTTYGLFASVHVVSAAIVHHTSVAYALPEYINRKNIIILHKFLNINFIFVIESLHIFIFG